MTKNPYLYFNKFVLRTPLIPFSVFDQIMKEINQDEYALNRILKDEVLLEAIYLSSPLLYEEIQKLTEGKIKDKKEIESIKYSFIKYFSRMSTRCTPFGLFAGFNVGEFGIDTSIVQSKHDNNCRHTRLDMNYLCSLSINLSRIPVIKKSIRYYPNSSIYQCGDKIRYVEYSFLNKKRQHNIVSIDNSEFIQKVLNASMSGAYFFELADMLVDDDITKEDSCLFIDELIDNQVLISELEPSVTGDEYFDKLLRMLTGIDGVDDLINTLQKVNGLIKRIDCNQIGSSQELYLRIIDELKNLNTDFEQKYLFQTDLKKTFTNCKLSDEVACNILDAVVFLNKITPKNQGSTLMTKFAESFYERYEEQMISLSTVLDSEIGIGYGSNSKVQGDINDLIDDVVVPYRNSNVTDIKWSMVQSVLLKKIISANKSDSVELEVSEIDFGQIEADWSDLPLTFSTMVEVFSYGKDSQIFLNSVGGSSAANLLGRFCHADDELFEFVKEIAQKEEELNPNVIFAEIVHLPESRIGNILMRPILRSYEIPYLASSGVESQFQIALSDLYIKVQNQKVLLFSKRLNAQIIPRLSTAHNYSYNSMPIYHFLCDLQSQNLRGGLYVNWGNLQNEFSFLPRLKYKNIILSLAQWRIFKKDILNIINEEDDILLIKKTKLWRIENNIPEYATLADGDNELFIDFDNMISLKTFLSVVKKRENFVLKEFPFSIQNALVKDSFNECYTNEFVLSFYNNLNN